MDRSISAARAPGSAQQRPRPARDTRLLKTAAVGALACAVATAGLLVPAGAVVKPGHTVFVLKNDSIVEAEGYRPGEPMVVRVMRDGVAVGSISSPASNPGGTLIINHDVCWDSFTPVILPGDVVTVSSNGGATVERVPVADIHVVEGPQRVLDTMTIRGRVDGPRIPVGDLQVEARTEDPIRFRPLAPGNEDGVRGRITYDGPTGGNFTATFTGLSAQQQQAADNLGEFFVSHAPSARQITMASEGNGAPGPGCPAAVRHAVTNLSRSTINQANKDKALRVSGMTLNATEVSVRLRDRDGTTVNKRADLRGAATAQTWRASFAPRALRRLDGRIVASARYTSGGQVIGGKTMRLLKDLRAPRRPQASPDGGTYSRRQAVSLSAPAGSQIRYTLGRGLPAPKLRTGNVYRGRQLRVTSSRTLKAIAVDKAGNVSRLTNERYVIR